MDWIIYEERLLHSRLKLLKPTGDVAIEASHRKTICSVVSSAKLLQILHKFNITRIQVVKNNHAYLQIQDMRERRMKNYVLNLPIKRSASSKSKIHLTFMNYRSNIYSILPNPYCIFTRKIVEFPKSDSCPTSRCKLDLPT